MRKRFPNLFIIGAPKCGTTSLAYWLSEHPQIYFYVGKGKDSKVEPHYWLRGFKNVVGFNSRDYFNIFDNINYSKYKYAGEASTLYLFYSGVAIKNIEEAVENPKYIVCIRNPIDMAFSQWMQHMKNGFELETTSFISAFNLSDWRKEGKYVKLNPNAGYPPEVGDYKGLCALGSQLENLFCIVNRERVLVLVLDDIKKNPREEWLRIMDFLQLSDDGRKDFPIYNEQRVLANKLLYYSLYIPLTAIAVKTYKIRNKFGLTGLNLLEKFRKGVFAKPRKKRTLSLDERRILREHFIEEIEKLEYLLGRKFEDWKKIQ